MGFVSGVERCRACHSERLSEVLNLGEHAISGFQRDANAPWLKAPLILARCENCLLVQLLHSVERSLLYGKYWYKSGTNERMVKALEDVAFDALGRAVLLAGDKVLDIGANDGTLIRQFRALKHIETVAVEPSDIMPEGAHRVVRGFFPECVDALEGPFKLITSVAQFYNVEDPGAYVAAIRKLLHPEGAWVVQMQDLASVYRDRAFDYICHEHLALWEPASLDHLLAEHGLEIADVSQNDVNGGSVRMTIMHGHKRWKGQPLAADWTAFHDDVVANKARVLDVLTGLCAHKVGAIAASTKGNTTLQYYGIGRDAIPYIGDRNPEKVGTFTPTGQLVVSEESMRAMEPDYLFALAWHFLESFKQREAEFLARGGKFIVPLPELRIVGGSVAKAA